MLKESVAWTIACPFGNFAELDNNQPFLQPVLWSYTRGIWRKARRMENPLPRSQLFARKASVEFIESQGKIKGSLSNNCLRCPDNIPLCIGGQRKASDCLGQRHMYG
ncbi:hypothetical protein M0R45_019635 [Rubus argutus]|uniref:Uncharacterized protein n=1 Tax=Rubus argutus TaxID=59490 RepID=A0AAW1X8E9_RUBAR